jgi:hypothetical protein
MEGIGACEAGLGDHQGVGPAQAHLGEGGGRGDQVVVAGRHCRDAAWVDALSLQTVGAVEQML